MWISSLHFFPYHKSFLYCRFEYVPRTLSNSCRPSVSSLERHVKLVPSCPFLLHCQVWVTQLKVKELSEIPMLIYVPPNVPSTTPIPTSLFPHSYSLYPFLSHRPLPWTMNTSGAFRIRRVGEWLGTRSGESIQKTGGLAEGRGLLTTSQ